MKDLTEKYPSEVIALTNRSLIKCYPHGLRSDSSNLDPTECWNYGAQMVALNFQKKDLSMSLNEALFMDNGGCGFVLKPDILRHLNLGFNPLDKDTMKSKKSLEIKVISAQQLPSFEKSSIIKDIIDPYVEISIHGIPADEKKLSSRVVNDNGYNPIWNQDFTFCVNCPELAFVRFVVKDEDIGIDDYIGEYTIRFDNMRQGYRHIKLKNKTYQGTLFVGIKIKSLNS